MSKTLNLVLNVWRQKNRGTPVASNATKRRASRAHVVLEMLDVVNEGLLAKGEDPSRSITTAARHLRHVRRRRQRRAPRPQKATTTCQLHMRQFSDGDEVTIEPWRADAFPVVKDLVVDRGAFDRIIQAGGYISAGPGHRVTPTRSSSRKRRAIWPWTQRSASAAARASPLARTPRQPLRRGQGRSPGLLPQGQPERLERVRTWSPRWTPRASATARITSSARPPARRRISVEFIARLNRDFLKSMAVSRTELRARGSK